MISTTNDYIIKQGFKYEGDDWWSWWLWIEGDPNKLDQVEKVTYTLHSTFKNPVREIRDRRSKFKLETEGWGVFVIYVRITLKNNQDISLQHKLYLEYPDGKENKA
jgi:transcription initiation factor IIF auxiliary subunit